MKDVAPIQYIHIWHMLMEGYARDTLRANHLKNSQRADGLLHNSPPSLQNTRELHFKRQGVKALVLKALWPTVFLLLPVFAVCMQAVTASVD